MDDTMIYAVIVFLSALAVSFAICSLIPWQGGHDRSYVTRRWVFGIAGVVSALGFWAYNDLFVATSIRNAGFQNMFEACNMRCLAITIGGYLACGVTVMLLSRHSKFGSILGRIKK